MVDENNNISLTSIVTFPGVIVHEFGHALFCFITRVRVLEICWFRLGDPLGYVIHEKPKFLLCI